MLDLLIVLAFVVYSTTAGLWARRKASRSLRQYFLAGQEVRGWRAGFSMAATQYAADTPLLVTGLVATGGIYLLWRFWIYGFGYLLLAFIFGELWRRSGVLTDAELTEMRYSGRGVLALRVLKALYYGTVVNCFFLAMVLIAAVRIAEVFLPWHLWLPSSVYAPIADAVGALGLTLGASVTGLDPLLVATNGLLSILVIVAFVFLYSATGGLRGVVATDVVQFLLMMVGTVAYAILVVNEVGGLQAIGGRIASLYGAAETSRLLAIMPSEASVLLPFLTVLGLQGLFWISSDGTGYLAQRSMACRSDRDARTAGVVFSWAQILVRSLVWLVIGVGLLVLYPFAPGDAADATFAAAREMTFVTGIEDLMPVGLRGVMLTALLAALASTIDTHLNWGASYWSNDLYQRLVCDVWLRRRPAQRELVTVARLSNLVILGLALAVMVNIGSIQATWFVSLVFGAGIGGVLMLRWLWERINLYSEVAAIASSLVFAPIVLAYVDAEWLRLSLIVLVSTGSAVAAAVIAPSTRDDVLVSFYRRVRPIGWWRETARKALEDHERPIHALRSRLSLTLLATASLFLMLVGMARLVAPLPHTSSLWVWPALAVAVALVPVWWRRARDVDDGDPPRNES